VAQPEQRDLAQIIRERIHIEPVESFELRVRGPARAHKIGMVGVRESIGVGTRRRQHGLLLEREDQVDGPGRYQDVGDRLGSLCVGGRVSAPLLNVKLAAEARYERREESRTIGFRRSDLEVWCSRPTERPRAEQRAAEVGGCAAAPGDHAIRWSAERPVRTVEHTRPVQRRVGVLRALHMELVARSTVECAA